MAAADPGSGRVSLIPVSNKLQGKVNLLREVIESEKLEVRRIGRKMRDAISWKEESMIRELDAILESVSVRIDQMKMETQKKIDQIQKHNNEIAKNYKKMEELLKDAKQSLPPFVLPDISETIVKLKGEMDVSIPYVKLTWRVDELRGSINRLCCCEQQVREDTPYQLTWSKCGTGMGEKQIYNPCGITINSMNENIYVADWAMKRVQIFSKEGEWIRCLKHNEMIRPINILFQTESIYILCGTSILKFNESSEKFEKSKSYDFSLRGICPDKTHIYVGNYNEIKLISLTPDLMEEKQTTLFSKFCKQDETKIRDISIAHGEFYVLLSGTEYPIQAFSKEGILTRCVIQKDSIKEARYFCLDQQLNLIVSDRGDCNVKIFSSEGKLLTQLSRQHGEFDHLSGVAVDALGCVVTVDHSPDKSLYSFSPF